MAILTANYDIIDPRDQLIIVKSQIKIETYLISAFIADLYDADEEFAASIEIEDFRIKEWDDREWIVRLIDQDPVECQEILEKLLERQSGWGSTNWSCSMLLKEV